MNKKNKKIHGLDLWKAYHLGLFEFDNLSAHDQREILAYDDAIECIVPSDLIEYYMSVLGIDRFKSIEFYVDNFADLYNVDKDIIRIRIDMIEEKLRKEEKENNCKIR